MRFWPLYLFISGCSATASIAPPMPPAARVVEWVKVSPSEIHAVCREKTAAVLVLGRINGCSVKTRTGCTIYAQDFKATQTAEMAILGHELKHCFDGDWHEPNQMYR